jgi:hypothetical protein
MKLLTKGNSKLAKNVGVWNILAGMEVCGRECTGCYALKEQVRWKGTVVSGRTNRLNFSKGILFVPSMVKEIEKSRFTMIRVHGSGEFYSQAYIDDWVEIARRVKKAKPEVMFYTYTKRDREFDFTKIDKLDNFVVHRSMVEVEGKRLINYGKDLSNIQSKVDSFLCPFVTDRTGQCGSECTWCMVKENQGTPILFNMH